MPYYTKYHVREQSAKVLLNPIAATLKELEQRTAHYATRLNLDPGADGTLDQATEALSKARQEIERLVRTGEAAR